MSHMERIGVRELRQNASKYLRRVAQGESIEITDRGRPVAVLVPSKLTGLDRLIAEGRVRPAQGDLLDLGDPLPLPEGAELPSERVGRAREERWPLSSTSTPPRSSS
jgi:prevent-host-death family protein